MDFDLSEDQQMLAKTVRDYARKESTVERFRKLRDEDGLGYTKEAWAQMGELGWLSVPFPESVGGFGGSFLDCGLVLEELGKTLVPEPYLASVVLAGRALLRAGDAEQHEKYLNPMIEGQTSLALAYAERGHRFDPRCADTKATEEGGIWKLTGEKIFVLNGHGADQLIVSAMVGDELGLFIVEGDADSLKRETVRLIDGHRGARIRFESTPAAARLTAASSVEVMERAMDDGAAAAAAEGLGVLQTMLSMTVEYLKTREQFDVKIGSFQALQHRAVEMFVEVELMRSITTEAMVRADEDGPERIAAIAAAKHQLGVGGAFVSRQALQLHGGIGVTDEADIGLFFKRHHALMTLFGDVDHHVRRYAATSAA